MLRLLALGSMLVISVAGFAQQEKQEKEEVRVLPVARTPESNTTSVTVSVPKNGTVLKGSRVWIQTRVDGFPLGMDSQFDRKTEVVGTKMGQTLHVVIDNDPYFAVNEPALDPFNEEGYYYDTNYKFQVPRSLEDGEHVARVFPARSYGESLKGEQTFSVIVFYVNTKNDKRKYDLSKPYLTYNEPSDRMPLVEGKPVLLDFYISNCELSRDGYKVRLKIDGKVIRTLISWQPYYIYGLKRGTHVVELELLDPSGKVVNGPFSTAERTITVR